MEDPKTNEIEREHHVTHASKPSTEQRKEMVKTWLKNPQNLALVGIFVATIALRFYYFILTKNQPLWWDEASYMATAKYFAGMGHYQLESIRLPGFPMLMSLFFMTGLSNEVFMRFVALFIPSLIVILLIYLCIKEMYPDKRIALISTLILTFLWEHVFYSNRFQTENFSLIFQLLATYIFIKVYMKKEDIWMIKARYSLWAVAFFSIVSVMFRPGSIPFVPGLFLFWIYLDRKEIFKKSRAWIVLAFIVFLSAFIYFFSKTATFSSLISSYFNPQNPPAWNSFTVFYGFYQSLVPYIPSLFFYAFLFGLAIVVIDLIINFSKLKTVDNSSKENMILKSDVFNIFTLLSVLLMFIFVLRSPSFEFRWYFPLLIPMLSFTAKGVISFSEYASMFFNNRKAIATALIIIIVAMGVYTEYVHTDGLVKVKLDSYSQVKDASLWIKDNSIKEDIIISASVPQVSYYSEREVDDFYVNGSNKNETAFDEKVLSLKTKYMVISGFEPGFTPDWAYDWPQRHNDTAQLVNIYYTDTSKTQPILAVYKLSSNNS